MNICYVAHRYYPYPGGTEYYVKNLAEETLAQGHDVTVLAGQHRGDQNGVRVTNDLNILVREQFDLVVVHGSGVAMQDSVLINARQIPSPVMFMIIRPEESKQIFPAMENSDYIACSTPTDWRFVKKYRQDHKAVQVNHSISPFDKPLNNERHNAYGSPYAISVGGFWSHKGHKELSEGWTTGFLDPSPINT
jgi:glycosyltransferase involved in cell wall biosynthesis